MAEELTIRRGETAKHLTLKRLALIWAQANGYSICALEVQLPRCRFRADVAAFRSRDNIECTAVFECKQSLPDLVRDNCESMVAEQALARVENRRRVIERNLRVHYPTLRTGHSLFPEFDAFDFRSLHHRGYTHVSRSGAVLRNRLTHCTKFEKLVRYHCANVFYLVVPASMTEVEAPSGWGLLVEEGPSLRLVCKPVWHDLTPQHTTRFLHRVAAAATRALNREFDIDFQTIQQTRTTSASGDLCQSFRSEPAFPAGTK